MSIRSACLLLFLSCTLSGCMGPATYVNRTESYGPRVARFEICRYQWTAICADKIIRTRDVPPESSDENRRPYVANNQ